MERIPNCELLKRVSCLDSTSFENLTLDLLRAVGFRNLVWRTPGADGGRDIEGEHTAIDPSGMDCRQKWYIECKRYSSSVDWPTVWKKLAYADSQGADYLFLVTNSQPSPQCETEIRNWNEERRRPQMRVWRGYDIPVYLRLNEEVSIAHGLVQSTPTSSSFAIDFASVLSKLVQAAHGAWVFEVDPEMSLVAATTLAELYNQRLQSLSLHGRFVSGVKLQNLNDWPWLAVSGEIGNLEEVGFRAMVATIRHVLQADQVECKIGENTVLLSATSSKGKFDSSSESFLKPVLQWASCDVFRIKTKREAEFSLRGTNE